MHILLINTNPVVSRLFVLCTRDDAVMLHEVTEVASIENIAYDIIFVDETSYSQEVIEFLSSLPQTKKVFISYQSESVDGFDMTIKKPFLPSEILGIFQDTKEHQIIEETEDTLLSEEPDIDVEEKEVSIFPLEAEDETTASAVDEIFLEVPENEKELEPAVLNGNEIEKIKSLLDMDDEDEVLDEVLSDEEIEAKKVEVIKEQLIAEGLEIVEEDAIFDELSIDLDGTLNKKKSKKKKKKKEKSKKKKSTKIKFNEKNLERIEDAVEMAMANMTKKQMKKLLQGKTIEVTVKLEDKH